MSIRLMVAGVTLLAPGNSYSVRFQSGVNIVAGPISTGKSSVLALLDYVLGSSHRPTYPEIAKCSDVLVEFRLGAELLTVQRSLHSVHRKARIYEGDIESVLKHGMEGEEVSAVHNPAEKSVSREILRRLGLDNIKVKTAPSQQASDVSTFSVRDLMHFIYVDQDRIDSQKSAFFEQHLPVAIKWRAAFEIVTGLYDEVAAALSATMKDAYAEIAQHQLYLDNVRLFLTRSHVPPIEKLQKELAAIIAERQILDAQVVEARAATDSRKGEHLELIRRRDSLAAERAGVLSRVAELDRTLRQLGKLRVQYARERAQLEFLKESESLVGSLPVVRCPACLQPTDETLLPKDSSNCHVCRRQIPDTAAGINVDRRLTALKRRVNDLQSYMEEIGSLRASLSELQRGLDDRISEVDATIRRLEPAAVFPEMRQLMQLDAAISLVESARRRVQEHLQFRERAEAEINNIAAIESRVQELVKELEERQRNRPSRDQVVESISTKFAEVLADIRFPDVRGARIDARSYIPIVRNQPYGELSSRGAIALAVSAWHLAALSYFLESQHLFPRIFILDSPLSNVGHDAADKDFRDQRIVDAFYVFLFNLHKERGDDFQLLICDNRPPESVTDLVVERFSGDRSKGRYGLISDESPPESP